MAPQRRNGAGPDHGGQVSWPPTQTVAVEDVQEGAGRSPADRQSREWCWEPPVPAGPPGAGVAVHGRATGEHLSPSLAGSRPKTALCAVRASSPAVRANAAARVARTRERERRHVAVCGRSLMAFLSGERNPGQRTRRRRDGPGRSVGGGLDLERGGELVSQVACPGEALDDPRSAEPWRVGAARRPALPALPSTAADAGNEAFPVEDAVAGVQGQVRRAAGGGGQERPAQRQHRTARTVARRKTWRGLRAGEADRTASPWRGRRRRDLI